MLALYWLFYTKVGLKPIISIVNRSMITIIITNITMITAATFRFYYYYFIFRPKIRLPGDGSCLLISESRPVYSFDHIHFMVLTTISLNKYFSNF